MPLTPMRKIADKSECAVVDIFCGIGGITHGFVLEDFKVVAGLDIDDSCRYAYEHNNKGSRFIQADLSDCDYGEIAALYPRDCRVKIMIGCAPCQPFSTNNSKRTKGADNDDKWTLVDKFAEAIEAVQPDIVSMENVPNLKAFRDGEIYKKFLSRLKEMGYNVHSEVVSCLEYGVPQLRKRLVVLASRFGSITMLPGDVVPGKHPTVRSTIERLERISAGEVSKSDPLHKARSLEGQNLRRIQQSKPGGSWEDWDYSLVAACHKKDTGSTYKGVYGRMQWDEPAPTITAQFYAFGSGRFGHPEQDRALSLREGALLQTFPADYEFVEPGVEIHFNSVGTYIGNAVPVNLARAIAKSIADHLGA